MAFASEDRRKTWPNFSPGDTTNRAREAINDPSQVEKSSPAINTIIAYSMDLLAGYRKKRDSIASCPTCWRRSMNSILETCSSESQTPPSSPRNCSRNSFNSPDTISFSSTTSDVFYSQVSTTGFSTPKYKSPCTFPTEQIEEAAILDDNDFQTYYYGSLQRGSGEHVDQHECRVRRWSFSSEGFRSIGPCQPLLKMPLMFGGAEQYEVNEESESWVPGSDSDQSTAHRHQRMISRPKPYQAFLNDVKRMELEAQINAWREAKQQKLLNRQRTQEAVIHAWEHKQTMKDTIEMKKIENLTVLIKTYKSTHCYYVNGSDKIRSLSTILGLTSDCALVSSGRTLCEEMTVEESGIRNLALVEVIPRLRGGSEESRSSSLLPTEKTGVTESTSRDFRSKASQEKKLRDKNKTLQRLAKELHEEDTKLRTSLYQQIQHKKKVGQKGDHAPKQWTNMYLEQLGEKTSKSHREDAEEDTQL